MFDVSQTLDGAIVASAAFRATCELVGGIRFEPIDGVDDRWVVEVDRIVRIDPSVRDPPARRVADPGT